MDKRCDDLANKAEKPTTSHALQRLFKLFDTGRHILQVQRRVDILTPQLRRPMESYSPPLKILRTTQTLSVFSRTGKGDGEDNDG